MGGCNFSQASKPSKRSGKRAKTAMIRINVISSTIYSESYVCAEYLNCRAACSPSGICTIGKGNLRVALLCFRREGL